MELLDWMTKNDVSRRDLAERLRITRQTVYNLLKKKHCPGLELAMRIQDETGGKVKATQWVP